MRLGRAVAVAVAWSLSAVLASGAVAQGPAPPTPTTPPVSSPTPSAARRAIPSRPLYAPQAPKPSYLVFRPRCAAGETSSGAVTLAVANAATGGLTALSRASFTCSNGIAGSVAALRTGQSLWARTATARGVTFYLYVRRTGAPYGVTIPVWIHSARAARVARMAAVWSPWPESTCQATAVAGGGGGHWYIDVPNDRGFGAAVGAWVRVFAYGQLYGGGVYGSWQPSGMISYTVTQSGAGLGGGGYTTRDGRLVLLGVGPAGIGQGTLLQWQGINGFAIPYGHWARMAVYVSINNGPFRWNWVAPAPPPVGQGAYISGIWCGMQVA